LLFLEIGGKNIDTTPKTIIILKIILQLYNPKSAKSISINTDAENLN
jgi:hypothetical protein